MADSRGTQATITTNSCQVPRISAFCHLSCVAVTIGKTSATGANHQNSERVALPEQTKVFRNPVDMACIGPINTHPPGDTAGQRPTAPMGGRFAPTRGRALPSAHMRYGQSQLTQSLPAQPHPAGRGFRPRRYRPSAWLRSCLRRRLCHRRQSRLRGPYGGLEGLCGLR